VFYVERARRRQAQNQVGKSGGMVRCDEQPTYNLRAFPFGQLAFAFKLSNMFKQQLDHICLDALTSAQGGHSL